MSFKELTKKQFLTEIKADNVIENNIEGLEKFIHSSSKELLVNMKINFGEIQEHSYFFISPPKVIYSRQKINDKEFIYLIGIQGDNNTQTFINNELRSCLTKFYLSLEEIKSLNIQNLEAQTNMLQHIRPCILFSYDKETITKFRQKSMLN